MGKRSKPAARVVQHAAGRSTCTAAAHEGGPSRNVQNWVVVNGGGFAALYAFDTLAFTHKYDSTRCCVFDNYDGPNDSVSESQQLAHLPECAFPSLLSTFRRALAQSCCWRPQTRSPACAYIPTPPILTHHLKSAERSDHPSCLPVLGGAKSVLGWIKVVLGLYEITHQNAKQPLTAVVWWEKHIPL